MPVRRLRLYPERPRQAVLVTGVHQMVLMLYLHYQTNQLKCHLTGPVDALASPQHYDRYRPPLVRPRHGYLTIWRWL